MTAEASNEAVARPTAEATHVGINVLALIVQISGPAYHALIAHAVGVGGYGFLTSSSSVVEGLSFFVLFGMDLTVRRWVSRALAESRSEDVHAITGAALRAVVIAGLSMYTALFFAAPSIGAWMHKPELVAPLRVLALGPVVYHVGTVFLAATQAALEMKYALYARSIVQPISLFACVGFASIFAPGVTSTAIAIVVGTIAPSVAAAVYYSKRFALGRTIHAALRGPIELGIRRFAVQLVGGYAFWVVLARIDVFVFGRFATSARVGVLGGCILFASSISQLKGAFDTFLSTAIPRTLELGDRASLQDTVRRLARWITIVVLPVALLFGGFADIVLRVLGPQFVEGAGALHILLAAQLIGAVCMSSIIVPMSGRTGAFALTGAICLVIESALLVALIPRYGLEGAAVASATGSALASIALAAQAYVQTRVQPISIHMLKAFVAAVVALPVGRIVLQLAVGPLAIRFVVGFASSAFVYMLCLMALGLHPEDRALVRGAMRRIGVLDG